MKFLKILFNINFAIFLLLLLCIYSSIGSIIEQDKSDIYYIENYSLKKPIWGYIDSNLIFFLGLNHIYQTFFFYFLLILLSFSLIGCTITRQLPLINTAKKYFFKKQKKTFKKLPFLKVLNKNYFSFEYILMKSHISNFFLYQEKNLIYGYKGLIGRLSPILVHFSILVILCLSTFGALKNFKIEEFIPKGEVFNFQNFLTLNFWSFIPNIHFRINDFWIDYDSKNSINQYYTNISILNNFGDEFYKNTLSINNPFIYNQNYFYQSEWTVNSIRFKNIKDFLIFENGSLNYPLFPLVENSKFWTSFVNDSLIFLFDILDNSYYFYKKDSLGFEENYFYTTNLLNTHLILVDIIPLIGLLIKYDFLLYFIYLTFLLLIIVTFLSYFPFNQLWIIQQKKKIWIGGLTNRIKNFFEIELENFLLEISTKY